MDNDKLDKIILKLIEQDEKIEALVTNTQFREFADKITDILSKIKIQLKIV